MEFLLRSMEKHNARACEHEKLGLQWWGPKLSVVSCPFLVVATLSQSPLSFHPGWLPRACVRQSADSYLVVSSFLETCCSVSPRLRHRASRSTHMFAPRAFKFHETFGMHQQSAPLNYRYIRKIILSLFLTCSHIAIITHRRQYLVGRSIMLSLIGYGSSTQTCSSIFTPHLRCVYVPAIIGINYSYPNVRCYRMVYVEWVSETQPNFNVNLTQYFCLIS